MIIFEADPIISGKSRLSTDQDGTIICYESSVLKSLACQMACFLLFEVVYPRKANDYFVFCQLEILKVPSRGIHEGRPGRLTHKGIRVLNEIRK